MRHKCRTYEAHYLAGLIAGALSEDGVIGYLANDPYQSKASRLRNANAFTLGAQKSKAAIRVLYAPGNDPDEELKTLIAAGADIVDLERALPSLVERLREHSVRYVVTKFGTDFEARIEAGASILNIAAAAQTPELVREARKALPDVPIIATGGKTGESILRTIEAGANAITYTPPSTYELFQEMMKGYRE